MSKKNTKKVLITGGAGYIGSILTPLLLREGYKVHVVDNLMYGQQSLIPCFINKNFEFTNGDIRKKEVLERVLKDADYIVHLAAIVGEPACNKNRALTRSLNTGATKLLNDLRTPSQKLLFASTGSVYGKLESICTEESPTNPLGDYGISKLKAEEAVKQKPNHIIYRFATAFGLSPRLRLDLLVNDFAYKAARSNPILLYEAHFKRTFIHVSDIARSFLHGIKNFDKMKNETYNVGAKEMSFTKVEVAEKIKEKKDFYIHLANFAKDPDQRDYEVSYAKMGDTGFTTKVSFDEGLDELLKGYGVVRIHDPHSNIGYLS